jgi:8-oxo-dGTP pyrophosphatase MutT (NUDIX family)
MHSHYLRKVQTSVTIFLQHGDEYLFLHRDCTKQVDPGRLNGIGGRLEIRENFLDAAVRETEEETGYGLQAADFTLRALGKLQEGYLDDWVFCCFTAPVRDKHIPIGNKTKDGTLLWIPQDQVLDSGYELVDDLNYIWKEIIADNNLFFFTAILDYDQKIKQLRLTRSA